LLHYCSRFGRQSQTSQRSTSNQESNVNLHYHLHLETRDDQKNQVTTTGGGYVGADGDTQVQVKTADMLQNNAKEVKCHGQAVTNGTSGGLTTHETVTNKKRA
jgi:hypothetical protein